MMTLEGLYEERCHTQHNIDQHLPLLWVLGLKCRHITEFGTDIGFSTTAFLRARPQELHCYDLRRTPHVDDLAALAGETRFVFHQEDTLTATISETDLLFLDTEHTYEQVRGELARHAPQVRHYLVFHDTISFPGIVPAITEFLAAHPDWRMDLWSPRQNGLAVLRRQV